MNGSQFSQTLSGRALYLLAVLLVTISPLRTAISDQPDVTLAEIYREGVDVSRYWVSEKLDGVRAYWDGTHLRSRQGNIYVAPAWFTAGFPNTPMDGELWMGRNSFQQLVSIVRRRQPSDESWRNIRYMVFDLPSADQVFSDRLRQLAQLIEGLDTQVIRLVDQYRLPDHASLMRKLAEVTAAGGEGLMLHLGSSSYRAGRTRDLLKVKPYLDAEARVIEHLPGKGKYRGMLGSLLVESPQGRRFRVGTGFSDAERERPPPIGSIITYKYHGYTDAGLPRFPSYLRVREE
ncbi:MAG: DNA ligase [Pseudomonadota bacterium]